MKKIGILGGTFNPIHFGHLILGQSAKEEFGLDKVLVMRKIRRIKPYPAELRSKTGSI